MLNWWEEMAMNVVLGIVSGVVKNPAKKASLEAILLHIADTIYVTYGIVPASGNQPPTPLVK